MSKKMEKLISVGDGVARTRYLLHVDMQRRKTAKIAFSSVPPSNL